MKPNNNTDLQAKSLPEARFFYAIDLQFNVICKSDGDIIERQPITSAGTKERLKEALEFFGLNMTPPDTASDGLLVKYIITCHSNGDIIAFKGICSLTRARRMIIWKPADANYKIFEPVQPPQDLRVKQCDVMDGDNADRHFDFILGLFADIKPNDIALCQSCNSEAEKAGVQ